MRQIALKISLLMIPFLNFILLSGFMPFCKSESAPESIHSVVVIDELQRNSFEILKAKCNICHVRQNPRKVFTLENMNKLAPKIHKQVFVKKRMPRGNKIKLTQLEYTILEKWLLSQPSIK